MDSLQKIKFSTTSALQIKRFQDLQVAVNVLRMMKFPLIILAIGTHACYHHVVLLYGGG